MDAIGEAPSATTSTASRPRRLALKLESYLWLTRHPVDRVLYVAAGWLIASEPTPMLGLVAFAVVLQTAGAQALNDLIDRSKDTVTAPYLPVVSGLVSPTGAGVFSVVAVLGGLTGLCVAASTAFGAGAILAFFLFTLLLVVAYSRIKGMGWLASWVITVQYSYPAVVAWLAAGAGRPAEFALLAAALTFHGLRANLYAGLRDFDSDPEVGNETTAVRLGLDRSVAVSNLLASLAGVVLLVLAAARGNALGVAWCAVAVAIAVISIRPLKRRFAADRERTRRSRSRDIYFLAMSVSPITFGFPIAVEPIAGLVTLVVVRPLVEILQRLYDRRLVSGRLAQLGHAAGGHGP